MANNQFSGSLSYQAPVFSMGEQSGTVGGGFNLDLPLATIAAFNSQALNFLSSTTQNNQGFLGGVISQQSNQINSLSNSSMDFSKQMANLASIINQRTTATLGNISANNVAIAAAQADAQAQIAASSSKGGFCFITTAVCEYLHLPDDCTELQTLREFRENYLKKTEQGRAEVALYYAIAPSIVNKLNRHENKDEIYRLILKDYIHPAIDAIRTSDYERAHLIYKKLCVFAVLKTMD